MSSQAIPDGEQRAGNLTIERLEKFLKQAEVALPKNHPPLAP